MISKKLFFQFAGLLSLATLLSKILGLFRQQYSLFLFGGGWEYDAFVAAFRIPNALRELLAEGALSSALIPVFSVILLRKGKKEAFVLANQIFTIAFFLTLSLALLGLLFSKTWMNFYHSNPSFPNSSLVSADLLRIMLFFLPFISFSALSMGVLNSMGHFSIPSLGPLLSNMGFLVFIFFFHNQLQVYSLGYATIFGAILYFLIQIPILRHFGFRLRFQIDWKNPELREFWKLFFPFALALGIPKLNQILANFYSDSITGANTALSQGFFLIQLPISLFVVSISTLSLPNLVQALVKKQQDSSFRDWSIRAIHLTLFFTLPSALILMVLHKEIPRLLYQDILQLFFSGSGKIDTSVIENISTALLYFAPAIPFIGFSVILIRIFQSLKNMKVIIWTSSISVLFHWSFMSFLLLYLDFSFEGIALSITLASALNSLLLSIALMKGKFLIGLFSVSTLLRIAKLILSASCMAIALFLAKNWTVQISTNPFLNNSMQTLWLLAFSGFFYLGLLYLLREREWIFFFPFLQKKL